MTNILKAIVVPMTLVAGMVALTGAALAGSDATYHWGYPDSLRVSPTSPYSPSAGKAASRLSTSRRRASMTAGALGQILSRLGA